MFLDWILTQGTGDEEGCDGARLGGTEGNWAGCCALGQDAWHLPGEEVEAA